MNICDICKTTNCKDRTFPVSIVACDKFVPISGEFVTAEDMVELIDIILDLIKETKVLAACVEKMHEQLKGLN
jgi:hypothetical protein